ncbi:MAG: hypothetical protein K2L34_13315, partial [Muribaculaceae bacterium]|nr:hypothetical protein [Muribaculaceae bacterium]
YPSCVKLNMRANTQICEPDARVKSGCPPTSSHVLRNTGSFSFTYYAAGRLKTDPVRGITSIGYDNSPRFPGGYFSHDGKPYYYITDYQGNNAKVVDANGGVRQTNNYYPYGEPWLESNWQLADITAMCRNRYLFGDKERLPENGINEYDFAARQCVASQMRFTAPDPLAEERPGLSPYIYCNSNPIMLIDPSGKQSISPTGNTTNLLNTSGYPNELIDWYKGAGQTNIDWTQSLGQNKIDWTKGIGTAKVDWSGASVGKNKSLQINASENEKSPLDHLVDAGSHITSSLSIANGIKDQIIEFATDPNPPGTLGQYTKMSRIGGGALAVLNVGCTLYNVSNYKANGGDNIKVMVKYGFDFAAGGAGIIAATTLVTPPFAFGILVVTTGYYILDVTTHGFGLDYSPNTQTNK